MAKKITRKQLLKEPDEFITTTGKLIRWATDHRKHIAITVAAIIAAGLIMGLLNFFKNRTENQAFALLNQANEKYQSVLNASNDPKEALRQVEKDFETIVDRYSDYSGGKVAGLEFANYSYEGGQYDRALALFSKAMDDFGENPSYRNFILSGLAYCHEAKEDYESAAKYFEMVAGSDTPILKDEALFNLGRVYATLGTEEKSAEAYNKLIEQYPDSVYIDMVKEKLKG